MKRATAYLVIAMLMVPTAARSADSSFDWISVRIVVGAAGAQDIKVEKNLNGGRDLAAPEVTGGGLGSSIRGGTVFVDAGPGGPPTISTTTGYGSMHIALPDPSDHATSGIVSTTSFIGSYPAGEVLASLTFKTGALWTIADVSVTAKSGDVTWDFRTGAGSTPFMQADPAASGAAVSVGSTSYGSSVQTKTTDRGIAGGIELDTGSECGGSWSAPNGVTGDWSARTRQEPFDWTRSEGDGSFSFAGPHGEWSWSWEGNGYVPGECNLWRLRTATFGAYAPIGDEWTLFVSAPGSWRSAHRCVSGI